MPKRRRKRGPTGDRPPALARRADQAPNAAKRQRQAGARVERDRRRRRASSLRTLRRGAVAGVGIAALAVGLTLLFRASGPNPVPEAAIRAADAAGCGEIQAPQASPAAGHLTQGETYDYPAEPATSGPHDLSPLPPEPHAYTAPLPETNAVHNLEHAYVLMFYRADGDERLPTDVVDRLTALANGQDKVILAPHPDLPVGASLVLTAWNKLQPCPPSTTPGQAAAVASGFIEAYRGSSNAPEPAAP